MPLSSDAAPSPEVAAGIAWLNSQVQSDGSFLNESASIAAPQQLRAEAAQTLSQLDSAPATILDAIQAEQADNTEFLSRQIIALAFAGRDATNLVPQLLARQNSDGGFGSDTGFDSNPLETAWALIALRSNYVNSVIAANALGYLVNAANADGGYGPFQSGSDVYTTSYVLMALQSYGQTYSLSTAITRAKSWLINAQTSSGVYADTLSNAIGAQALSFSSLDPATYNAALTALRESQLRDGSWSDDVYLTAIALRALSATASTPPPATAGQINGVVYDASSQQPLPGVTVQLSSALQSTDASGQFVLNNVPAGTYTLTASRNSYLPAQVSFTVTSGVTTQLPPILLSPAPATTGTLVGTVIDGSTGTPLVNVNISVVTSSSTLTAQSGTDGAYQINGIEPGSVTVTASKSGYQDVSGTGQIVAGGTLVFSPSQYPVGSTAPTSATLSGTVIDASSQQPLAGASITVAGQTTTSDGQGHFAVANLTSGAFTASISIAGYNGATLTGSLANGDNNAGTISLSPTPVALTASSVSGIVTRADNGQVIGGAQITVKGIGSVTTGADGHFTISNISTASFEVDASAPGFIGQFAQVPGPGFNNYAINFSLTQNDANGLQVLSVTTDKSNYDSYEDVVTTITVQNNQSTDVPLVFDTAILDANNNVVADIAAKPLVLGQSSSDALQIVPTQSTLTVTTEWNTLSTLSGSYTAQIHGIDGTGRVMVEGSAAFAINSNQRISGGITLSPPIAQAGVNQSIHIQANALNHGNVPIPAGQLQLNITLADVDPNSATAIPASASLWASGSPLNTPVGAVYDAQGNFYTVNQADRKLIKIAPDGQTSVLVQLPTSGAPVDLTLDPNGNFWAAYSNGSVVKVAADLSVTTLNTELIQLYGIAADTTGSVFATGRNSAGQFVLWQMDASGNQSVLVQDGLSQPTGVVSDSNGNLFVSNYGDNTISEITPDGKISPFASGLNRPEGITRDAAGNFYVANSGAHSIVKIAPDGTQSIYASGLSAPFDLRFDSRGNLFVTDPGTNTVDKVASDGTVTVFARSIANLPQGMKYDADGNLYIANDNNTLTKLAPDDTYSVVSTSLSAPRGMVIDPSGNVFVANSANGTISKTVAGTTSTFASGLSSPYGVTFDSGGTMYVSEKGANRISIIDATGQVSNLVDAYVASPQKVLVDSQGNRYILNSSFIAEVQGSDTAGTIVAKGFSSATSFAFAPDGGFYVLDSTTIKKVSTTGTITSITSVPYPYYTGIVVDAAGDIYYTDYSNHTLIKYDTTGTKTIIATLPYYPIDMIDDGNGGFYVSMWNGQVVAVSSSGQVSTYATGVYYGYSLARGLDGSLYAGTTSGTLLKIDTTGKVTTFLSSLGSTVKVGVSPTGEILIADSRPRFSVYTTQGVLTDSFDGILSPQDMVWDGQELIIANSNGALYSLVPGQNPHALGFGNASGYLAYANGAIYSTSDGGAIYRATIGGTSQNYFSGATLSTATGIAIRADGDISVANRSDSRITTLDASKTIVASYASIANPAGITLDQNDNVYIGSRSVNEIEKIDPSGKQASVFASSIDGYSLLTDASGNIIVNSPSAGVVKYSPSGSRSTLTSKAITGGIAQVGSDLYIADTIGATLRHLVSGQLPVFAAGFNVPRGIVADGNGTVYVANEGNGVITQYVNGTLSNFATGLSSPHAISLGSGSTVLYTGTTGGDIIALDKAGNPTSLGLSGLQLGDIYAMATRSDGNIALVPAPFGASHVYVATPPRTQTLPAPGTIVETRTVSQSALAVGDETAQSLDFGDWVPPYAGDYLFTITSTNAGISGTLNDALHVGPHAVGDLTTNKSVVPPGTQTVRVEATVTGADFTSLSKVDASNLTLAAPSSGYPITMGADTNGNIYYASSGSTTISRVTPDGTVSVFTSVPSGVVTRGVLPIDGDNNLYVGSANRNIYKIAPDGSSSILASLSSSLISIAADSDNNLIVATSDGQIQRISITNPQAPFAVVGAVHGIFSITTDGRNNIYYQDTSNHIGKIFADGSTTILVSDAVFEREGENIAGDCADNLFLTPDSWPRVGQSGEEHILAQVIGRTGQVAQIFDGSKISSALNDLDFIVYDKYGSRALIWTDNSGGHIYSLPVTCGAIGAELHMDLPTQQTTSGFSVTPTAVMDHGDGTTEYVWNLKEVTASGQQVQFDTALDNLTVGESRAVASKAFLVFTNSFTNQSLQLDLAVPSVRVASDVQLNLTTDAGSYPANTPVNISTVISDGGPAVNGGTVSLIIRQKGATAPVADLGTVPYGALATGGQLTLSANWNTATILAGDYEVYAQLYDDANHYLGDAVAAFTVTASDASNDNQLVTLRTTTDRPIYNTTDSVSIENLVRNLSVNQSIEGALLTVTVTDAGDTVVDSQSLTWGELVSQGSRDSVIISRLNKVANGTYTIQANVTDATGATVASATTTFQVQENLAATIKGSVSAQSASVQSGDTQTCIDTVSNTGTLVASGLNIQQLLVRLDQNATITTATITVNVDAGGVQQLVRGFSTSGLSTGDYACVLQAQVGGTWQTLGYASFSVTVPPIKIDTSAGTGPRGRVLVLMDEDDARSCSPIRDIELWTPFPASLPDDATIDVELQDSDGNRIDAESVTLNQYHGTINQSKGKGADLAIAGVSPDVLTVSISGDKVNGGYRVIATVNGNALPLMKIDSGLMGASCGWPVGTGTHFGGFHCSGQHLPFDAHPSSPPSEPTQSQRRAFLETQLKNAGWSYKIVTDEEDFEHEFRSGNYNEYALFAEREKLDDTTQDALREAVNMGAGLLDAGEHDSRQEDIDDALGISPAGQQSRATTLALTSSPLSAATTITLQYPNDALRIKLAGASAVGTFTGTPGPFNTAVTTYTYGQGHSVYAGYDLLAEATQAGEGSVQAQLLMNALNEVEPVFTSPTKSQVIPVRITLVNQGIATAGQVVLPVPVGVTVMDAGSATLTNNILTWNYALDVDQTLTFDAWVRLPPQSSAVTFDSTIQTIRNGTVSDYGHATFTVNPLALATLADAQAMVAGNHQFRDVQNWLNKAQFWLNRDRPYFALNSLVQVTDSLLCSNDPQANALRMDIDQVIWDMSRGL